MMAEPENALADLLSRVSLKDRKAFEELYSRTSAKLFGTILRILKDEAKSSETLQEVYIKVWHKADLYRPHIASPITWLCQIARNHAIDQLRKRQPPVADLDLAKDLSDPSPSPEAMSIRTSEQRRLAACLEELDARHAQSVRLAYLEGAQYAQIAEQLNIPINTIKTWVRRSLGKLKECMGR